FKTAITEPVLAQLRVVPTPPVTNAADTAQKKRPVLQAKDYLSVYIEPGVLTVTAKDSLSGSEVKGSASHAEFLSLQEKSKSYNDQFRALYQELAELRKNKDSAAYDLKIKTIDSLDEVVKDAVYLSYLKSKGKTSPVALYALTQYAGYAIDPKKAEPAFNLLGTAYQNSPTGKNFKNRIELAKKTEIGQYAIPFTQNDTSGNAVTLASFKGKYVLIDFWASWCGPCRAENPNVVKAFNKYGSKGFTVLGISLDQPGKKEAWLKAIYDDQLAWTHVSDLKYWNNDVAQAYGIMAIPQNYLLDKEGKIVAKNVRGEDLEKTLSGIFTAPN
ncbi:MAG: TlpA family protein disulfide reductase, partial [Chitinophagaceae bacterium]